MIVESGVGGTSLGLGFWVFRGLDLLLVYEHRGDDYSWCYIQLVLLFLLLPSVPQTSRGTAELNCYVFGFPCSYLPATETLSALVLNCVASISTSPQQRHANCKSPKPLPLNPKPHI